MGQTASFKKSIPELKNLTLKGVKPSKNELGRGSYGTVFIVKHKGVQCAAKRIYPHLIDEIFENAQANKADFIQECIFCSHIQHPSIVQFLGVYYPSGQSSRFPVMVMELMDINLTKFIENSKSRIVLTTKLGILYDVSDGLSFLHSRRPSIVHCNLSSNNVLLTSQLVAKIGDLGVAKLLRSDEIQNGNKLVFTRPMLGTLAFMPPEAMLVGSLCGTSIDVYSFGNIALHVFSEKWPIPSALREKDKFSKKMVTYTEVERRQQYFDIMTGEVAIFKEIVKQCLNDDPDSRPRMLEVSSIIDPSRVSIIILHVIARVNNGEESV